MDLLIVDSTFEAVDRNITPPEGTEIVDVSGRTVLPGLFDCHAHLGWDNIQDVGTQSVEDSVAYGAIKSTLNMRRFLEAGVTTIRDLGVHWIGVEARNAVIDGITMGPRILAAGPPITTTGGHCWWCGTEVDGADGIRHTIRVMAKRGVDLVKVIATQAASGSKYYPGSASTSNPAYSWKEMRTLIDEAHNLGRKVTCHATTPEGAHQVVKAGIDCIEHGTDFTEKTMERMLEQGTFVVPTMSVGWMKAHFGHLHGFTDEELQPVRKRYADPEYNSGVRKAAAAGVNIAVGTDQGSPGTPPEALVTEMFLHLHYRIAANPMTVIQRATAQAAILCGVDHLVGRIMPGMLADFIVVSQDPLDDIENLRFPDAVYQAGKQVASKGHLLAETTFYPKAAVVLAK